MDNDVMNLPSVLTCVNVRHRRDISWEHVSNPLALYIKPHPTLTDEEKRKIMGEIDNFFPDLEIFVDNNEGLRNVRNLAAGAIKPGKGICIMIYSVYDYGKIGLKGEGREKVFLLPQFEVDEELRNDIRKRLPAVGIFISDIRYKERPEVAEKWIMRIIQLGCWYLVIRNLTRISRNFENSTTRPALANITVPNFIVPNFNVGNFMVENFNLEKLWGRGGGSGA